MQISIPSSTSSTTYSCDDGWSSPELDVVSCTPGPHPSTSNNSSDEHKRYFCQRCLNHFLEYPRKGHKPVCRYANCKCNDCMMVEYRRRLNNQLSQRKSGPDSFVTNTESSSNTFFQNTNRIKNIGESGKKIRDPKCARCSAHGQEQALRGHKKALCPFLSCKCHLCVLVEHRRSLMAKQIKLRRDQQKARKALSNSSNDASVLPTTASAGYFKSKKSLSNSILLNNSQKKNQKNENRNETNEIKNKTTNNTFLDSKTLSQFNFYQNANILTSQSQIVSPICVEHFATIPLLSTLGTKEGSAQSLLPSPINSFFGNITTVGNLEQANNNENLSLRNFPKNMNFNELPMPKPIHPFDFLKAL